MLSLDHVSICAHPSVAMHADGRSIWSGLERCKHFSSEHGRLDEELAVARESAADMSAPLNDGSVALLRRVLLEALAAPVAWKSIEWEIHVARDGRARFHATKLDGKRAINWKAVELFHIGSSGAASVAGIQYLLPRLDLVPTSIVAMGTEMSFPFGTTVSSPVADLDVIGTIECMRAENARVVSKSVPCPGEGWRPALVKDLEWLVSS